MSALKKYYGKYRGMVVNNLDPQQIGRIQVQVPDVSGAMLSTWAMPCVPIVGRGMGTYMVPQIGAGVWIEFEQGDPDSPIWVGGFWGSASEVPKLAFKAMPLSQNIVLQTALEHTIVVSDMPDLTGGIMLRSSQGAVINVTNSGVLIQNGKGASILLTGSSVVINNGALVIQ
jgi:uncharacterized protein involved in type VI secretion and phage assembly